MSIISQIAKKINSKYCIFSYDDDLSGKNYLINSINFLDFNKNYITTNGFMASANIYFLKHKVKLSNFKLSNIKLSNINFNTYNERFLNFNYQEGFAYGVYRRKDFINIFDIVKKLCQKIKNPIKKIEHTTSHKLMTITFAMYNLLSGNIKSNNDLMLVRLNHQQNQTSGIKYYEKLGGWHIVDFYKDCEKYNKYLSEYLFQLFPKIKKQFILNLIYLHIYIAANKKASKILL